MQDDESWYRSISIAEPFKREIKDLKEEIVRLKKEIEEMKCKPKPKGK
jgi:hypothetical protein